MPDTHLHSTDCNQFHDVRSVYTADDGLLWLSSLFRTATAAEDRFYTASLETTDKLLKGHLIGKADEQWRLTLRLAEVICTAEASGIVGALAQAELVQSMERMSIEPADFDRLCASAMVSIRQSLRGTVAGEGNPPVDDAGTDVSAVIRDWKAMRAA